MEMIKSKTVHQGGSVWLQSEPIDPRYATLYDYSVEYTVTTQVDGSEPVVAYRGGDLTKGEQAYAEFLTTAQKRSDRWWSDKRFASRH